MLSEKPKLINGSFSAMKRNGQILIVSIRNRFSPIIWARLPKVEWISMILPESSRETTKPARFHVKVQYFISKSSASDVSRKYSSS